MRLLVLLLAGAVGVCLLSIVTVGARADARHLAAGAVGPPPSPLAVRALSVLAVLLFAAVVVLGVATVAAGWA